MTNVERRHNAPDIRPLPRTERRQGLPDMRDSEKPRRSAYRVNYYVTGVPVSAFVVAYTEQEAAAFLGVRDGSVSVSTVCSPVEIVGIDKVHPALEPMPVNKVPLRIFEPATPTPPQFTDAEVARLRELAQPVAPPPPATK